MCRLTCVITSGQPLLLADILTRPRMGIIHQSFNCKERLPHRTIRQAYHQASLNGDGFGVGWYSSPSSYAPPVAYDDEESCFDSQAYEDCSRETNFPASANSACLNDDRSVERNGKRDRGGEPHPHHSPASLADAEPCVFTSLKPAWADRNLFILAEKIASRLIFAHVRAASTNLSGSCAGAAAKAISAGDHSDNGGLPLWATCSSSVSTELCCHPFRCGRFLFMHNGGIGDFEMIRRPLLSLLPDPFFTYAITNSSIDSVCLFALFLSLLPHSPLEPSTPATMRNAVEQMINVTCCLLEKHKSTSITLLNVVVTDGACVVATKFVTGGCGERTCDRERTPHSPGSKGEGRRRPLSPLSPAPRPKDKLPAVYSQWYKAMLEATEEGSDQEDSPQFEEDGSQAASLYFATGTRWQQQGADPESFVMTHSDKRTDICIVTSEPLTANPDDWMAVPRNHLVLITPAIDLMLHPITVSLTMPSFFFTSSPSRSLSPFSTVLHQTSPRGRGITVNTGTPALGSRFASPWQNPREGPVEKHNVEGGAAGVVSARSAQPLCRAASPEVPACVLSPRRRPDGAKTLPTRFSLFTTESTDARVSLVSSVPSPAQSFPHAECALPGTPVSPAARPGEELRQAAGHTDAGGVATAMKAQTDECAAREEALEIRGTDKREEALEIRVTDKRGEALEIRVTDKRQEALETKISAKREDGSPRFAGELASTGHGALWESQRPGLVSSRGLEAFACGVPLRVCEVPETGRDDCFSDSSPSAASPHAAGAPQGAWSGSFTLSPALPPPAVALFPGTAPFCPSVEGGEEKPASHRLLSPLAPSRGLSLPPFFACSSPLVSLYSPSPSAFPSTFYHLVHTLRVSRSAILSMTAVTVRFLLDTSRCSCALSSFSSLASGDESEAFEPDDLLLRPGASLGTPVGRALSSASRHTQARYVQQSKGLYLTCRFLIAGRQDGSITVVETPSACLSRRRCFQAHTGGVLSLTAFAVTPGGRADPASEAKRTAAEPSTGEDAWGRDAQARENGAGLATQVEGGKGREQSTPVSDEEAGSGCTCCRRQLPKIYLVSGSSDTSVALWDISSLVLSSAAASAAAAVAAPPFALPQGEDEKTRESGREGEAGRDIRRESHQIEDVEMELDANALLALRIRLRPHQGDVLSVSGFPAEAQSNEEGDEGEEGCGTREERQSRRGKGGRRRSEEAGGRGEARGCEVAPRGAKRIFGDRRLPLDSGAGCVYTYYHCSRCCDLWGRRPTRSSRKGSESKILRSEGASGPLSFSPPSLLAPPELSPLSSGRPSPPGLDVSPIFASAFSAPSLLFLGFQSTKVGVMSIPSLLRYIAYVDAFLVFLDRLLLASSLGSASGASSAASSRSSSAVGRATPSAETPDEAGLHHIRLRHEEEGKKIFALAAALLREVVLVDTKDHVCYPRKKPKRGARHPGHPCCFSGGVFACKAPDNLDVFPLINASLQDELQRSLRRYRNLSLLESFAEMRSFEESAAGDRRQEEVHPTVDKRAENEQAEGEASHGHRGEEPVGESRVFSKAAASRRRSACPPVVRETAPGLLLARTLSETLSPQPCTLFALSKASCCGDRLDETGKGERETETPSVPLFPLQALGCSLLSSRDLRLECRFLPFALEASGCSPHSQCGRDRSKLTRAHRPQEDDEREVEGSGRRHLFGGSSWSSLPGTPERGKRSPSTACLSPPASPTSAASRGGFCHAGAFSSVSAICASSQLVGMVEPQSPAPDGGRSGGDQGLGDRGASPNGDKHGDSSRGREVRAAAPEEPCASPQEAVASSPGREGSRRQDRETDQRQDREPKRETGVAMASCMRSSPPESSPLAALPGAADPPGHVGFVECVVACGPYLCSGGGDGRVVVWAPKTGTVRGELRGHRGGVLCLSFYAGETDPGYGCARQSRRRAHLPGGAAQEAEGSAFKAGSLSETLSPLSSEESAPRRVRSARFGPAAGRRSAGVWGHEADVETEGLLFSGSRDKTIRVWRIDDMVCVHALLQHSAEVLSLTSSCAHGLLVSGAANGEIFVWCVETLEVVHALGTACLGNTHRPLLSPSMFSFRQAFGPDGDAPPHAEPKQSPALARSGQGVAVTALLLVGRTAAAEKCFPRRRRLERGFSGSDVEPRLSGAVGGRGESDEGLGAAPRTVSQKAPRRKQALEGAHEPPRKEARCGMRTEESSGDSSGESSGNSSEDDVEMNLLLDGDGTDTVQLWAATGNGLLRVWQVPSLKNRGRHLALLASLTETGQSLQLENPSEGPVDPEETRAPAGTGEPDSEARVGAQKPSRGRESWRRDAEAVEGDDGTGLAGSGRSRRPETPRRQTEAASRRAVRRARGPRSAGASPSPSLLTFAYLQRLASRPTAPFPFGVPFVSAPSVSLSSSSCFMNLLRRFVSLPSVSGSPACVVPGWQAASFLASCFERLLGAEVRLIPTSCASSCSPWAVATLAGGERGARAGAAAGREPREAPANGPFFAPCAPQSGRGDPGETAGLPLVLARLGSDPSKPTVVFYSHYDVVGAEVNGGEARELQALCGASPRETARRKGPEGHEADGDSGTGAAETLSSWRSNPWSVWGEDGYVYGRGVSDNKGPILCTLFAVRAFARHRRRRRHLAVRTEENRDRQEERRRASAQNGVGQATRETDGDTEGTKRESGNGTRERKCRTEKGLPFNFVWVSEGREESGSGGFEDALKKHLNWIVGTKFFVICTNSYWIDDVHPCLVYGMRGVVDARIVVKGGGEQTGHHSGVHGGAVAEPLQELLQAVSSLTDVRTGRVRVPHFYDGVLPLPDDEVSSLMKIPVDAAAYGASVKHAGLRSRDGPTLLRKRWLEPCLSVVNISSSAQCLADGAAAVLPASSLAEWTGKAEPSLHARCDHAHPVARDGSVAPSAGGNFRIIPSAAFCDLCIRLVPSQNPVAVFLALKRYVEALFRDMQSEHQVYVHLVGHGQGWKTNRQSHSAKELFSAAHQAIQEIWGVEPLHILEGGSMPVIKVLTDLLIRHSAVLRCASTACAITPSLRSSGSSSFVGADQERHPSELTLEKTSSNPGNEGQKETDGKGEKAANLDDVVAIQIPLGQASDNAHLPNERIRVINLYRGAKVLERTLDLLAQLHRRQSF
uniref:WD domain-containing protein, putative n=1 Tax=Neospora caninum (strain Liverpool) TaxID=572307 RepID=A0A0F7U6T7_NEOCL|nr:TPA: WD domain-containing protein, putative [Neospora caninum Liverpool]